MRSNTRNYRQLFLETTPLMDVRAPIEFSKGAFPQAHNLPLMNDDERHEVGICYRRQGQDAALALGHQLVSGSVRTQRIEAWLAHLQKYPQGYLYCFRGGQRSRISQQWLQAEAGIFYPYVEGGYKAMRRYLLENLEISSTHSQFIVLGGLAGSGKTDILAALDGAIDLEGLAHHRGSSFGKRAHDQPGQIDFEHALSITLLRKQAAGHNLFVVEDESRTIGRCAVPATLHQRMKASPIVWLLADLPERAERILRDYVILTLAEFEAVYGQEEGFERFAGQLRTSLRNIERRLGNETYRQLANVMDAALDEQRQSSLTEQHKEWIYPLLHTYYDPMYNFQFKQKSSAAVFRGHKAEVLDYLRRHYPDADNLDKSIPVFSPEDK